MFSLLLPIIYLSFIGLGIPDSLLGAAWPSIYPDFDVPLSYAGILQIIMCAGSTLAGLFASKLSKTFKTGTIAAFSTLLTAIAIFGFSISKNYLMLCIFSIPYGLGAGCIDATLNNYVAINYKSKHMSWLHCMWGVGATVGPYIMSFALTNFNSWNKGYQIVSIFQIVLTLILLLSLPIWKSNSNTSNDENHKTLSTIETLKIKGVKEAILIFFAYCALEQTLGLWAASYFNLSKGLDTSTSASLASLFFIGITLGRFINGFLTSKLKDDELVRIGISIILIGLIIMLLPLNDTACFIGILLIGMGCAPIYPCVMHATPAHFTNEISLSVIGLQMVGAYIGILFMPSLFGIIANNISISLLPIYLLVLLFVLFMAHQRLIRITGLK